MDLVTRIICYKLLLLLLLACSGGATLLPGVTRLGVFPAQISQFSVFGSELNRDELNKRVKE